jgi:hypothetical protein
MKTIEKYQQNQTQKTYYRDFLCVEVVSGVALVSNEKNLQEIYDKYDTMYKVQIAKRLIDEAEGITPNTPFLIGVSLKTML